MKNILEFKDKFKGQRCFIIGNGPSLNRIDILMLKNEISFGVNSMFLMTKTNGFRPTFFVVEDNMVFKENQEEIDKYLGVTKILPKQYAEQLKCKDECYTFEMDTSFYNKNDKNHAIPQFFTFDKLVFYCGQSVTYINMQLAYFMGFTEVYLIGMDFSYSLPSGHHQEGNHIKATCDDVNHFHKDYFGKGKTWKDPKLGRVLRSYHKAKHMYEADGRKIFNATHGGQLHLFKRVDFDSLFDN